MNEANLGLHERCKTIQGAYETARLLDILVLITKNGVRQIGL